MKSRKQLLESRIRELRRVILHEGNNTIRKIHKSHMVYLQSQVDKLEVVKK